MSTMANKSGSQEISDSYLEGNIIKVLVVDDDETNRIVLQRLIEKQGHLVVQAENGQEAITVFHNESPDLVLMDVMMPVMDGYHAAQKIKAACRGHFVPIIFLTAISDESGLAKCIESGGDDFLTKPYNHIILNARMEALIRMKELYNTVQEQKYELAVHQYRMEQEAELAKTLLQNIVGSGVLNNDCIKYILSPMSLFSGDMLLAADKPSGGINILMGDFTGHGMAAATGALPASTIFYEMSQKGYSIAEIATEINSKMNKILPTRMFLAACIFDMDPVTRKASIWCGGIPDVLIVNKGKPGIRKRIRSTHFPLGIVGGVEFDSRVEVVDILDGDHIYVYTDGVTETTNPDGEMFGQKRLEKLFENKIDSEPMFDCILHSLASFRQGQAQNDDVALAEIQYDEVALANLEHLKHSTGGAKYAAAHWRMTMHLQADLLRHSDPLPVILQSITEIQGLNNRRQHLYTILAELFSNALEHGLLDLDSKMKQTPNGFTQYYVERNNRLKNLTEGCIVIDVQHTPNEVGGRLIIRVEDSGKGFDYSNLNMKTLAENSQHSGRGVPLINSLCESVTYIGKGNIVEAVYIW